MQPTKYVPFTQRYSLKERKAKFEKQKEEKPNFIPLIIERHPKSKLPDIDKSRFVCQKFNKFILVQKMIEGKVQKVQQANPTKKQGKSTFFMYIKNCMPSAELTMGDIYQKYKSQDGFLYIQYGQMETFGAIS